MNELLDNTLFILDGYALIYRAYHAISYRSPFSNSRGENIGAVLIFFRSLFAFFTYHNPQYFVVALDSKEKSFRFDIYKDYKAQRQKTPQDLHTQTQIIENALQALQISCIRKEGYEADDIIATLCTSRSAKQQKTYIISSDKDLMQLVDHETVRLIRPQSGQKNNKDNFTIMDRQAIKDNKGVWPEQIRDFLALIGDSSDNIPGVKGIGEKSAQKLLDQYQNIEKICSNIDNIQPHSLQNKLREGQEDLRLSLQLIELCRDVSIDINSKSFQFCPNYQDASKYFTHYEIPSLVSYCTKMLNTTLKCTKSQPYELFHQDQNSEISSHELSNQKQTQSLDSTFSNSSSLNCNYQCLKDKASLLAFLDELIKHDIFSFDTETDSLNTQTCNIIGMSISYKPNDAVYIPVHSPEKLEMSANEIFDLLRPILENPTKKIVGQNIKFDLKILQRYNVKFIPYFDTMIAAWVLDSESRVNLDFLSRKYLSRETISFSDLTKKEPNLANISLQDITSYACEDADITLQLYHLLNPKLFNHNLQDLFYTLEMPLIPLLVSMETTGIQVNIQKLSDYSLELTQTLSKIEKEIYELAGTEFNLNSPKQLQEILFNLLKLPQRKKIRTGFSTDNKTLEDLCQFHPLPLQMINYRQLSKLKLTYTDSLIELTQKDSKIHCDFLQIGTSTGRLSCQNPNLQNIPIRTKEGRKVREVFESRSNWKLISADYTQIELVVLAYLSQDQSMIDIFEQGHDLHKETAAFMFNIAIDDITTDQRRMAKSINFGIIYGMSAFRLSNELKISRAIAVQFIDSYFLRYPKIKSFMEHTITETQKHGGVHTILGRWRAIPYITSLNKNEQFAAQRVAVNTIIQGSAADIIKKAMLLISDSLTKHKLHSKILLQVHDELIIESPSEECPLCCNLVSQCMLQATNELPVPMRININIETGKNWGLFH